MRPLASWTSFQVQPFCCEDRRGVARDVLVARQGEARQGRGRAVRVVAGHGDGSLSLVGRDGRAARVDAAGVGDDDLVADGRHGRRVVVGRQQADVAHRVLRRAVVAGRPRRRSPAPG